MKGEKFTGRAIAYLKGTPLDSEQETVRLSSKDAPFIQPYIGRLQICYLVDEGQSYKYVQNRHVESDQVNVADLHQIGLRNLKNLISQKDPRVRPYDNVFSFMAGGDFEASVMLLDEFWNNEFRQFIKGDYAVVVPSRDVLAFCDAQSDEGIVELQQVINRVWPKGDHLVSNQIYIRQREKWRVRE